MNVSDRAEFDRLARAFEGAPPEEILLWAREALGPRVAIGTAFGATGMVLLDIAQKAAPQIPIFTIDTGYLFQETLDLKARVEARYGIRIESLHPRLSVAEQDREYGLALYGRDADRCCRMRKVEPLQRKLADLDGWVNSLRRDQSEARKVIRILEPYRAGNGRPLVKIHPMANWTRKQIWDYIHTYDVPYNPLMDRGYASIGCWPCTQAIGEGADERAGRWSGSAKTECGIHTFLTPAEEFDREAQLTEAVD